MLPSEKLKMAGKLQQKTAYALQSEIANEILTDEHCVAAHLPSLNALRLINSRRQCPENEPNAVVSLYELRKIHIDCIQKIDYFPFGVSYSTPSQRAWYKKEFGYKKRSTISVDASGVGIRSPTEFRKCIYLYIITAQGKRQRHFSNNLNHLSIVSTYIICESFSRLRYSTISVSCPNALAKP